MSENVVKKLMPYEMVEVYRTYESKKKKILELVGNSCLGFFLYFVNTDSRYDVNGYPTDTNMLFEPVYRLTYDEINNRISRSDYILVDLYDAIVNGGK